MMFCFFLNFLAVSTIVFANPVPNDGENAIDLTGDFDTANDPASLKFSPITNPVVFTDPNRSLIADCTSDTSMENSFNDNIQKRGTICPAIDPKDINANHPVTKSPTNEPETTTTSSDNPCAIYPNLPNYLSCGGEEVKSNIKTTFLIAVQNCMKGMPSLFFPGFLQQTNNFEQRKSQPSQNVRFTLRSPNLPSIAVQFSETM